MTRRLKFFSDRSELDGYVRGLADANTDVFVPVEAWRVNNIYMLILEDRDPDVDGSVEVDSRGSPSVVLELSTEGLKNLCKP